MARQRVPVRLQCRHPDWADAASPAPEWSDAGLRCSGQCRATQQVGEIHYNLGPSNVTGLKGISGEDIHVELNLRRGQDVVQVGAEVADIEHGIIATDAIVKRGTSVLHSPAGH